MRSTLSLHEWRVSRAYIPKINERLPQGQARRDAYIEPERIQFKCGANIKARVEYIEEKGQTTARNVL